MSLPFVPSRLKATVRKRLLHRLGAIAPWTWDADGMATTHNTDFLREPEFDHAYQLGVATGSWGENNPRFRVYLACWAALQAQTVSGDYVECGVNRGGMARTQMELLDFNQLDKSYWLVDTFCGFPDEQKDSVSPGMPTNSYDECYKDVVQTFAPFPRARLVRGIVPEVLSQVQAKEICYLSLDMNSAIPEIAAIKYFWTRLSKGAFVVMDDYAYRGYEPQKRALDGFAREQNVSILGLPTGQGLIIKG